MPNNNFNVAFLCCRHSPTRPRTDTQLPTLSLKASSRSVTYRPHSAGEKSKLDWTWRCVGSFGARTVDARAWARR